MDGKTYDHWKISDIWLGLLFLVTGLLMTAITYLAFRRGVAMFIGLGGWLVGPAFLLLGLNAIIRCSYAVFQRVDPENNE